MREKIIYAVERNREGYYVIRGIIGKRMYLYYSRREAEAMYRAEVNRLRVVHEGIVFYKRE